MVYMFFTIFIYMKILISEIQIKNVIKLFLNENNKYWDEIEKQNEKIKRLAIKNLNSLVKVTKPGKYKLYRGTEDGNQNPGMGIYANGIHYTNDIDTAQEFGNYSRFTVTINNPLIVDNMELKKYGKTSDERTKTLLDMGYDTLVIVHNKQLTITGLNDYYETLPYKEYEVIKLKNIKYNPEQRTVKN